MSEFEEKVKLTSNDNILNYDYKNETTSIYSNKNPNEITEEVDLLGINSSIKKMMKVSLFVYLSVNIIPFIVLCWMMSVNNSVGSFIAILLMAIILLIIRHIAIILLFIYQLIKTIKIIELYFAKRKISLYRKICIFFLIPYIFTLFISIILNYSIMYFSVLTPIFFLTPTIIILNRAKKTLININNNEEGKL